MLFFEHQDRCKQDRIGRPECRNAGWWKTENAAQSGRKHHDGKYEWDLNKSYQEINFPQLAKTQRSLIGLVPKSLSQIHCQSQFFKNGKIECKKLPKAVT